MSDMISSISARVFTIQGVHFISGLYWRTLSGEASISKERPKTIGKTVVSRPGKKSLNEVENTSSDLVTFRQFNENTPVQVGLGQVENADGWKGKDTYSLPSFLFKALSSFLNEEVSSVCIIVPIDENHYALVAQNEGKIIPGIGDIFDSKESVTENALQLLSSSGFRLFAPSEIDIPGKEKLPSFDSLIDSLTQKELNACLLNSASPNYKKISLFLGLLGAIFISGMILFNEYEKYLEEQETLRAQQMMAEMLAKQQKEVIAISIQANSPLESLNNCFSTFANARLYAGGWSYINAKCQDDSLSITYKRNGSKISYLKSIYPNANFSDNGNEATIQLPSAFVKNTLGEGDLVAKEVAINALNSYSHAIDRDVTFKITEPTPALPGREGVNPAQAAKQGHIEWQISLPFSSAFTRFPIKAASLQAVLFLPSVNGDLLITVKGTTYVKP